MKWIIITAILSLGFLTISCSDQVGCVEDTAHLQYQSSLPLCTLSIVDSIGVEFGDSNYVFGSVREVDLGSSGDIYVLDWIKCRIFQYSPNGEFIRSIGRRGGGPGELLQPGFMVVTDSGLICISDADQGWICFSGTGEELCSTPCLSPKPMQMTAVPGGGILGIRSSLSSGNNCLVVEKSVCFWNETNPDSMIVQYLTREYSFDTTDINRFRSDMITVDLFPMLLAAGSNFVCAAPSPKEEALLLVYSLDGTFQDSLELPYPSVLRSEEEILEQKEFMEEYFYATSRHMHSVNWDPFPAHPLITSLGVDSLDRIWVQRGFEQITVFDLFDRFGEHIQTAVLPQLSRSDHCTFHLCREGIIAVPDTPESFYEVYLVEENDKN